jgi:hypothetical protein
VLSVTMATFGMTPPWILLTSPEYNPFAIRFPYFLDP